MAESVHGKRARFVSLLVEGASVAEASLAVGRSERTGRRWLSSDPAVQAALSEAQSAVIHALSAAILARAELGAQVLGELLDDDGIAPYVRLGATKVAIDAALRLYEFSELSQRLSAVEQALEAR